jgi:hypothetical protein
MELDAALAPPSAGSDRTLGRLVPCTVDRVRVNLSFLSEFSCPTTIRGIRRIAVQRDVGQSRWKRAPERYSFDVPEQCRSGKSFVAMDPPIRATLTTKSPWLPPNRRFRS